MGNMNIHPFTKTNPRRHKDKIHPPYLPDLTLSDYQQFQKPRVLA